MHDVNKMYGIDAARECQVQALESFVRPVSGLDARPLGIIADTQTSFPQKGRVSCATRASIAETDPSSIFKNAAFEEPLKQILEGAAHAKAPDSLLSISASTQVGNSLSMGTGSGTILEQSEVKDVQVFHKNEKKDKDEKNAQDDDVKKMDESDSDTVPISKPRKMDVVQATVVEPIKTPMTDEEKIVHEASFPQRQGLVEARDWGFYQFFSVDGPQCVGGGLGPASVTELEVVDQAEEPVLIASFEDTLVKNPDQIFFPDPLQQQPLILSTDSSLEQQPMDAAARIGDGLASVEEFCGVAPWDPSGHCQFAWIEMVDEW